MKTIITVVSLTLLWVSAGCGTATVVDEPDPPPRRVSAKSALIGRISQALDVTFTAEYEWSEGSTVTVWAAEDGTWRVDVPGWGHGGAVDVSVAWTTGGFFQCADEVCVKLAGITGEIPEDYDPKVQRPFVEWLPLLLDRHLPFAVSQEGDCFNLTPNTVVVDAPIPAGQWCLDQSGTVLSVAIEQFGTLTLTGPPQAAAATVELPGEVVEGEPVGSEAPEPPEPTPSPSETSAPSDSPSPAPEVESEE
ncbi:hypothetical protein L0U85_19660 [Glycomyces sp. L485]|uniref:hypothetical protein n=1 Tax=Glycomyces sp. L485 TaxID=2909235 RepID=UPI001F4B306D|nr:hypothetical protein [Glycomyces sp. L485]MCH7233054.1 hypothetical protein [Glycomyces sp. L485]